MKLKRLGSGCLSMEALLPSARKRQNNSRHLLFERLLLISMCVACSFPQFVLADQGQDNPMGVTGVYNGNVTTAGSYDPFTGNAVRVVDDIVVPGAVGSYPLKWTRYFNSRVTYDFGSTGGNWRYSYVNYSYRDGSCAGGVTPYGNVVSPPTTCTMLWFPDGRFMDLTRDFPGVPETVAPYTDPQTNTTSPALFLTDGGKVLFQSDDGNHYKPFKILDPYGHATTIAYGVDGSGFNTTTITEPGGRYLLVTYGDVDAASYTKNISWVKAFDGVNSTPTQTVHYIWSTVTLNTISPRVLTQVDYSDGKSAHYTYAQAKYYGPPICYPPGYVNTLGDKLSSVVLATADDVRFEGPMRQIAYIYQTDSDLGLTTKIKSENHLVNGAPGEIVSQIEKYDEINKNPYLTETRGDGATRIFHYHRGCRPPPCPQADTEPCPASPQPTDGKLLDYTNFQDHTKITTLTYGTDVLTSAVGYITAVTDQNSRSTTYTRGANGWEITKITYPPTATEPNGSTVTQEFAGYFLSSRTNERYDANEAGKPGSKVVYVRADTANPNAITEKDYKGQDGAIIERETFTYNNFGQILKHGLRNGAYEYFQYDLRGLLLAKTNPTWTNVAYDGTSFPAGEPTTAYSYYTAADFNGVWTDRVKQETDARGKRTVYEYDRAYDASGQNSGNSGTTPVAGRGLITKVSYIDDTHDGTISGGTYKTFGFNQHGDKLWEENELRQRTSYVYDDYGRVTSMTDPIGNVVTSSYVPWGYTSGYVTTSKLPFVTTTPAGQATNKTSNFYYDADWHRTRTQEAPGVTGQEANTWFGYDAVGNQTYVTDPRGTGTNDPNYSTTTAYDERNRKLSVTDPQAHVTRFGYDRSSNITSITRADTSIETKDYDELNRVTHTHTPKEGTAGAPTVFIDNYFNYFRLPAEVTMTGALKTFTDGEGKITTFRYDAAGMQTRRIYPDSASTPDSPTDYMEWAYDNNHNIASRRTVSGATQYFNTPLDYDARNRKRSMRWSNGADSADFDYDAAGRLTSAINPNSSIARSYDAAGELVYDKQTVSGFALKDVEYLYTKTRPTQMYVTGASYDYTFSYDAMGRFETIKPTGGGSTSFQYKYDAASNEIERDNLLNGVNQFYTRDNLSRMSERDVKLGTSVMSVEAYGYDSMSRLTSTARENGLGDTFTYWLDGEIQNATYAQPTPTPSASPTPTPANQCRPVTFSTTGGGTTTLKVYLASATSGATIFYTIGNYDYVTPTHNGLTALGTTKKYTGTPISVSRGQRKFIEAVAYKSGMIDSVYTEYDANNAGSGGFSAMRVFDPTPHAATFYFDKSGNRTSVVDTGVTTSYTTNILNQYTTVGADTVTNDPTKEHQITAYQGNSYSYVNDERLAQITSTGNTYQLYYDALGRCVKRTLNGATTYYIYDGEKPILEYNAAGTLVAKNLYGKGIDEILYRYDSTVTPNTLYYQDDHEGNITHLTDSTAAVWETYRYDVFGAPDIVDAYGTHLSASSLKNRFMFTGREYSGTFGVYEYRARAYHPWLGRFMSEDPKGFVYGAGLGKEPDKWDFFQHPNEGELNLYRYCANDPLGKSDPTGLIFLVTGGDKDWIRKTEADLKKNERDLVHAAKAGVKGAEQALNEFRALKNDQNYVVPIIPAGQTNLGTNNYNPNQKTIGYEAYKANNATARDADGSLNRDASVGLGHEIGHAIDHYFGRLSYGPANDTGRFPNRGEESAVEFENVIRAGRWPDDPGRQRPQF